MLDKVVFGNTVKKCSLHYQLYGIILLSCGWIASSVSIEPTNAMHNLVCASRKNILMENCICCSKNQYCVCQIVLWIVLAVIRKAFYLRSTDTNKWHMTQHGHDTDMLACQFSESAGHSMWWTHKIYDFISLL